MQRRHRCYVNTNPSVRSLLRRRQNLRSWVCTQPSTPPGYGLFPNPPMSGRSHGPANFSELGRVFRPDSRVWLSPSGDHPSDRSCRFGRLGSEGSSPPRPSTTARILPATPFGADATARAGCLVRLGGSQIMYRFDGTRSRRLVATTRCVTCVTEKPEDFRVVGEAIELSRGPSPSAWDRSLSRRRPRAGRRRWPSTHRRDFGAGTARRTGARPSCLSASRSSSP